MNLARCLSLMIAGSVLATAGRAAATDLLDYSTPGAKKITVIDVARFRATQVAKLLAANRSLGEYFKAEIQRAEPSFEAWWKKHPYQEAIEQFADKTSKWMICDNGGLFNFVVVCEGVYDQERIRKGLEEMAVADGKKLSVSVKPRYTRFALEESSCVLFINDKTVAFVLGKTASLELIKLLDQDEIAPATGRCATIVKKLLSDRAVCVAAAGEDAPGLFESKKDFKKSYDIEERSVYARDVEIGFKYRKTHETRQQAEATITSAERKRAAMINRIPKPAWAATLQAVSIEQNDTGVTISGVIDVGVVKDGLLEILSFPKE